MGITYDKIADALYIYLRKAKVDRTVEVKDSVIVDLGKDGKPIGIEILGLSSQMSKKEFATSLKMGVPILPKVFA